MARKQLDPYTLLCVARYHAREGREFRKLRDGSDSGTLQRVRMSESASAHSLAASHWRAEARALSKTPKAARMSIRLRRCQRGHLLVPYFCPTCGYSTMQEKKRNG